MSTAYWRLFVVLVLVVMMGNLLFIDWYMIQEHRENLVWRAKTEAAENLSEIIFKQQRGELAPTPTLVAMTACDTDCQEEISRQVKLAVVDAMPDTSVSVPTGGGSSQVGTFYVPLGLSGSTKNLDWTSITNTETEIDWGEYGSSRDVYWEVYAKVYQGNGQTLVRLFDQTHGVPVWGSEVSTTSQDLVLLKSGTLTYASGKVTYVVQAKTLTGYEAFVEGGKVRVVVR